MTQIGGHIIMGSDRPALSGVGHWFKSQTWENIHWAYHEVLIGVFCCIEGVTGV